MANFDPDLYLATRFYDVNVKERVLFPLQRFHEEFSALPGSLKILDYGTGPVMMTVISAARCASEIILSDYNQQNRESLKAWLNKDPDAFNWSPFFEHVVMKLEGKSKDEAREREFTLRKIVKDVVHCDIYASSILTEGYEGPYDVVSSSGCLDSISASRKAFNENVKKLAAYLKPGGRMMLYLSERKMDRESGVYLRNTCLLMSVVIMLLVS